MTRGDEKMIAKKKKKHLAFRNEVEEFRHRKGYADELETHILENRCYVESMRSDVYLECMRLEKKRKKKGVWYRI